MQRLLTTTLAAGLGLIACTLALGYVDDELASLARTLEFLASVSALGQ